MTIEGPLRWWFAALWIALVATCIVILMMMRGAQAHLAQADAEGVSPEVHRWIMSLRSTGGAWCCDLSDTHILREHEWRAGPGGYEVLHVESGTWMPVPAGAIVIAQNRMGKALAWFGQDGAGWRVRCFLPGAGI